MQRTVFGLVLALLIIPNVVMAQAAISPVELDAFADPDGLFVRDTFRLDTVVCPFKGEVDYEPGEIECFLLQVPENREKPDSRFIELDVVKLASTWDDEGKGEGDKNSIEGNEADNGFGPCSGQDNLCMFQ